MKLNLRKLNQEIEGSRFSKSELAVKCGIDRKTIENVLAGRDPKLSTIISLATMLGIKIGYLFDEEEKGSNSVSATDHSQAAGRDLHVATEDAVLAERVKHLEALLKEKDERIYELKERIEDLKTKS